MRPKYVALLILAVLLLIGSIMGITLFSGLAQVLAVLVAIGFSAAIAVIADRMRRP